MDMPLNHLIEDANMGCIEGLLRLSRSENEEWAKRVHTEFGLKPKDLEIIQTFIDRDGISRLVKSCSSAFAFFEVDCKQLVKALQNRFHLKPGNHEQKVSAELRDALVQYAYAVTTLCKFDPIEAQIRFGFCNEALSEVKDMKAHSLANILCHNRVYLKPTQYFYASLNYREGNVYRQRALLRGMKQYLYKIEVAITDEDLFNSRRA